MIRPLLVALAISCIATPAAAHRQPEVETTVEVVTGDAGDVMHLTHRLHAHDALTALRALGVARPRLEDPEHQARLALYVADRFELTGEAVTKVVGAEVEGNYLFVYLVHPEVAGVAGASILSEVAPGWSNTVHVKDGARTLRSVTFTAETPHADEPVMPGGLALTPEQAVQAPGDAVR